MTITPESLQRQWNSINYKDGGFLQIDIQHSLEWHIGYKSISQKTLLLVCNTEIIALESSKSMAIGHHRRATDNRWTLTFELQRNEQQSVFAILCCDLIENSRLATTEKDALALVIGRYKQWSQLLESQKSGLMDEHHRKGLLGELLFLEQRFNVSESTLDAIQGWVGPEGGDQDFMYPDGWYEVKCVGDSAKSVTISSLEQLDCKDNGELVIMRIDKVAPGRTGAISLNDIVYRISDKLSAHLDSLALFRTKLMAYGYMDLQEYSEQKYYYVAMQRYHVAESFPRLTKKMVPVQVVSLRYELSLPSLDAWKKR